MSSILIKRIKKLEQKNDVDFDTSLPLHEWSTPQLVAYMKSIDPEYEKPDLSNFSIDDLRAMRVSNRHE